MHVHKGREKKDGSFTIGKSEREREIDWLNKANEYPERKGKGRDSELLLQLTETLRPLRIRILLHFDLTTFESLSRITIHIFKV